MNIEREIEIEYEKFVRDVNDYAFKRAEEANKNLKDKGIDARINYSFADGSDSLYYKVKSFIRRIWNNNQ